MVEIPRLPVKGVTITCVCMECTVQVNKSHIRKSRYRVFFPVGIQVAHYQHIVVFVLRAQAVVLLNHRFCLLRARVVELPLSVALVSVQSRTTAGLSLEVVEREYEYLPGLYFLKRLYLLSVLHFFVVRVQLSVGAHLVAAIHIARLGVRAACRPAVIYIGVGMSRVRCQVFGYLFERTLSLLYLHQSVDVCAYLGERSTGFGALFLVCRCVVRSIACTEIFHQVVLQIHRADQ